MVATVLGTAFVPLDSSSPDLSSAVDTDFAPFMTAQLGAPIDSTDAVAGMVESRSRNVLALRAEANAIESIIHDIDAFFLDRRPRTCELGVVTAYRSGSDFIIEAISVARSAFGSFDFSSVPNAIPLFNEGRKQLDIALSTLKDIDTASTVVQCRERLSGVMPRTGNG